MPCASLLSRGNVPSIPTPQDSAYHFEVQGLGVTCLPTLEPSSLAPWDSGVVHGGEGRWGAIWGRAQGEQRAVGVRGREP